MLKNFENHIRSQHPDLLKAQTYLLALSGGVDSVVLGFLLKNIGVRFEVAHCNFELRGAASDSDQIFVTELAKEWGVKFHTTNFDTKKYAKEKGISVEMAARDLRYAWFDDLTKEHHFRGILIAHHANDQAETVLINLSRGSSIHGLAGMRAESGSVIRPLLPFTRAEILDYAEKSGIKWVEDHTNADQSIPRNAIRHSVVPSLERLNPNFIHSLSRNAAYSAAALDLFDALVVEKAVEFVSTQGDRTLISIPKLKLCAPHISALLYEILKSYDLQDRTEDIAEAIYSQSGKVFYSATHRMLKDRGCFIIEPLPKQHAESEHFLIPSGNNELEEPFFLHTSIHRIEDIEIHPDSELAFLDADKLTFPLLLRKAQTGDEFAPFGMGGRRKKVSKYLKDIKIPLFDKENIWVICSAGEIVWLVGHRISDDFRVSDETKTVFLASNKHQ